MSFNFLSRLQIGHIFGLLHTHQGYDATGGKVKKDLCQASRFASTTCVFVIARAPSRQYGRARASRRRRRRRKATFAATRRRRPTIDAASSRRRAARRRPASGARTAPAARGATPTSSTSWAMRPIRCRLRCCFLLLCETQMFVIPFSPKSASSRALIDSLRRAATIRCRPASRSKCSNLAAQRAICPCNKSVFDDISVSVLLLILSVFFCDSSSSGGTSALLL